MKNNLIEFLDLGHQPLANAFIDKKNLLKKESKYRLKICFNKTNFLVSIKKKFGSEKMFNNKYPYRSSMSNTVLKSYKILSRKIKKVIKPKTVLEIGSNDGAFIKFFNKNTTVGIEPCKNIEKLTKQKKLNTYPLYWNDRTRKIIKNKYGKFDLIFSANTISHIKDLDNVFRNISHLLVDEGVLIIEDPSLLECLKKNTYDQFYNEHIYVFSTLGLNSVLKKNGLEIFNIEKINIHGGSNRYYIKKISSKKKIHKSVSKFLASEIRYGLKKKRTYVNFAKRVKKSKKKLINIIKKIKKNKKKIIGYGATAKSTTVLNYCEINNKQIDYFLDTTPEKQNKYTPGTKIKVKKYNKIIEKDIKFIFLGAWNFKKEIFKKEKKYLNNGGKFILHTPFPKIVP